MLFSYEMTGEKGCKRAGKSGSSESNLATR